MNLVNTSLRAAACALLTGLAACAAAPPPRMMLLSNDTAVPPVPAAVQRPILVVRTAVLPEYLDRRAMLYRSAGSELQRFPDTIWAERLTESVTRWIAQQLAVDAPGYDVEAFTTSGSSRPALELHLELESFEPAEGPPPSLRLRGQWRLSGQSAGEGVVAADVPMGALEPAVAVAAMRTALAVVASNIAAGLPK
jgi:uncharacterized lipoprotein YmbA